MGWKKKLASMNLVELQFLNFIEPPAPHALNRDSTEVEIPPTNSILSESTLPLRWRGVLEFWLVEGFLDCPVPSCYHSCL